MAAFRARRMRIAYQGNRGLQRGGGAAVTPTRSWCLPDFEEVFDAVEAGTAAYGVLPIENSIGGSIHRNYDLLLEHDLPIVGEVELPVVHHLLALPGATLDGLRRVYSHPQALAQCERFLRTLTGVEIIATYDTAGSAKMVADEQARRTPRRSPRRAPARCSASTSLASSIQDFDDNITRFLVDRPAAAAATRVADKTTIVFSLPNEPGSLFKALSVFALRGIDLTKLESRPIPGRPWEYLFYVDLAAARDELPCARALAHLARVRADAAHARLVRELEDARGPAARSVRGGVVSDRPQSADDRPAAARRRARC